MTERESMQNAQALASHCLCPPLMLNQGNCKAQELVFQEERCENDKALRDYGISEEFIKQVGSESGQQ